MAKAVKNKKSKNKDVKKIEKEIIEKYGILLNAAGGDVKNIKKLYKLIKEANEGFDFADANEINQRRIFEIFLYTLITKMREGNITALKIYSDIILKAGSLDIDRIREMTNNTININFPQVFWSE